MQMQWRKCDGVVRLMRVIYSGQAVSTMTTSRFNEYHTKFYQSPVLPNLRESSRNLIQIQINEKSKK